MDAYQKLESSNNLFREETHLRSLRSEEAYVQSFCHDVYSYVNCAFLEDNTDVL